MRVDVTGELDARSTETPDLQGLLLDGYGERREAAATTPGDAENPKHGIAGGGL